ncbi:MAG TPA: DUF2752 domain-containing protein [Tepidisphaeraceae bacterium]|nr:DUF2752 domain-containing protein [Tepidisphaeraceae bacterium]
MIVPYIHTPRFDHPRVSVMGRLVAGGVSLGCLTVLCIARLLVPDPAGLATHMELGLQPCAFLVRTGIPCPTCGMTTSFCWFAHGNLLASAYIQPMGCILAVLCAATFWVGLYIAFTGRPVHRLLRRLNPLYSVIVLLVFAAVAWAWKIFIYTHGLDRWR